MTVYIYIKIASSVFSLTMLYICTCSVYIYPHLLHITVCALPVTVGILCMIPSMHIGTSVYGTVYINVH